MNITFHECRYILHLKDYDSGVFFYREVLGLQPNYNWSIVPDQKGYRFYMGSGRLEITQIPFTPRQGHSEFLAQCSDLPLCMERILEEMPHIEILSQDARQVTLRDTEGNLVHLLQDDSPCSGGDVIKRICLPAPLPACFMRMIWRRRRASTATDWGFRCWSSRQMRCCFRPAMHSFCCAGVRQAAPWARP